MFGMQYSVLHAVLSGQAVHVAPKYFDALTLILQIVVFTFVRGPSLSTILFPSISIAFVFAFL